MHLSYINKDGKKERPVMIHRGIFGSLERFIGILVEHFQGSFPVWLSPIQVIILPISDKFKDYANQVKSNLKSDGIRVELNERNETLQAKIRNATLQKIPYIFVVGDKEKSSSKISTRTREGKDLGQMTLKEFTDKIHKDIDYKL
jgi:threonyl-tRNA synthetase